MYSLAVSVDGLAAALKPPPQVVTETCGAGISCSCRVSGCATQTTSKFTNDIAKSLAIDVNRVWQAKCPTRRCSSTRDDQNDFSLSRSLFYVVSLNLTFLNAFPNNRVAICRWDHVSTMLLSRVIDDQSFKRCNVAWRLLLRRL